MMLLKAAQHFLSLQHDHILCSRPCRDPANGADIADRFVRQHGDQIRRVFFSRFFTSEQKPFAFSLREKSTADCITAHADIDLLACVDKTCDCFHFQASEKIIPYSEHEKNAHRQTGVENNYTHPSFKHYHLTLRQVGVRSTSLSLAHSL